MSTLEDPRVVPNGAANGTAAAPPSGPALTPEPARTGISNAGAVVLGILLIVLGAVLLLRPAFSADWSHYGWPAFVILPGLALFLAMAIGDRTLARLAAPASVVTVTGLILLVQNTFDVWQTWAYAWALVCPTAVGLGLWLQGALSREPRLEERGRTLLGLGAALFLVGAAFFEGVVNLSGLADATVVRYGGAAALILVGAALLLFRAPRPSARS
jgi:hypothetical protein